MEPSANVNKPKKENLFSFPFFSCLDINEADSSDQEVTDIKNQNLLNSKSSS